MSNFNQLTTIEGVPTQVNYDNINYILPIDEASSMLTFIGGETLLVKEKLNLEWPLGDNNLLFTPPSQPKLFDTPEQAERLIKTLEAYDSTQANSAAGSPQSERETREPSPPSVP
jgi:hypothetical protein